jgi:hypothetical protein
MISSGCACSHLFGMNLNEAHFIKLLLKKFKAETTDIEENEIEQLLAESPRAQEIYAVVFKHYFPPEFMEEKRKAITSEEIQMVIKRGQQIKRRKTVTRFVIVLAILAILLTIVLTIIRK